MFERPYRSEARAATARSFSVQLRCRNAAPLLLVTAVALGTVTHASAQPVAADGALDKTKVSAQGRDRAELTVKSFGRYAITVKSKVGVALELVDKLTGPGATMGTAGKTDGRIDGFFDRGTYRVLTAGAKRTKGVAQLEVHPYRELNGTAPPRLVELKPIDATLADFEQRSWWLEVTKERPVVLEAAGRNLADLRIWKDGTWLVDVAPSLSETTPRPGRPLAVARLFTSLEPGLYLVTAYGGPAKAWAEEDGAHPFHLRFGIPRLPSVSRRRLSVGPFGYDRYLVREADYFRVELPEAKPVTLEVKNVTASNTSPFLAGTEGQTEIKKNTNPPVAELSLYSGSPNVERLVTVGGKEGQPYILQGFRAERYRTLDRFGSYWVSTVGSGHPEDELDVTGVISSSRVSNQVYAEQTIELDGDHPWSRRFNLLETATIFFRVKEGGTYNLAAKGPQAKFRFEPFLTSRPAGYKTPEFAGPGKSWQLDPGLWVLTLEPTEKGVQEITVARTGWFGSAKQASLGAARLPRASLRFPSLAISTDDYTLRLNDQPGVRTGIIVRTIPLDLRDPLFITQAPGESVKVPFTIDEDGELTARAEDGTQLELSLDGGALTRSAKVTPGPHEVTVRHSGDHLALYSLGLEPTRLLPTTPLPPLPDGRLAQLPKFPVLTNDKPLFLDLERNAQASFLVRADSAALHRLESTGRLATEGKLRTRVITSFATAAEDGVGRNFLLQHYLGQGDYQLTVGTRGQTRGHLGVSLQATPTADGGALELGVPARATLPSGTAIIYPFEITKAGTYRLRAVGVDRTLSCRLEDAEGWPLVAPGGKAEFTRTFEKGRYRLVVLPEPIDLRVVTLLEPVTGTLAFKGKGPHSLPLDVRVGHTFVLPKSGEKSNREAVRPDVWEVTLPADADVTIELGGKLQADVIRVGDGGTREKAGYVPPLRSFEGPLTRGNYRLEVTPLGEDSWVPYTIAVRPRQLVEGLERRVSAPGRVPLSVGEDGLIELSSFGTSDVRARLVDASGRTIAKNDDRPDDWNFHLARRLAPGEYDLVVDPVASSHATTSIAMKKRVESVQAALTLPAKVRPKVGRVVQVFPLEIPAGSSFFVATARSAETLGLVLEGAEGSSWRALATSVGRPAHVEVPLDPARAKKLRLRLWSADERSLPVDLRALAFTPRKVSESELARGVTMKSAGADLEMGLVEVELERAGTFQISGNDDELIRWTAALESPARDAVHGLFSPNGGRVWLARDLASSGASAEITAKRVKLEPSRALQVELDPGRPIRVDVARRKNGPVLVEARSKRAQVGVAFVDGARRRLLDAMDVHRGAATTLLLGGSGVAEVETWPAEDTPDPFDVHFVTTAFEEVTNGRLPAGVSEGVLTAGSAARFTLPSGAKRVRLSLEDGLVAALSDADRVRRLHWADGQSETFDGTDGELTVLNPLRREARWSVEIIPVSGLPDRTLTAESPREELVPRAGSFRLDVSSPATGAKVHVRGGTGRWVSRNGRVAWGSEIDLDGEGGTLLVSHGPGLVLTWTDGKERDGLFARSLPAPQALVPPASTPIAGSVATFRVDAQRASMVHVRTTVPVVTRWSRNGAPPAIDLHPNGSLLDAWLPAGASGQLVIRALAGAQLSGNVEITTSEVPALAEGLGPELVLSPGTMRTYSFEVKRTGDIGLGVRSDAAGVETVLMDTSGRKLGHGVIQLVHLEKGTYLLGLRAPESEGPVRARPALAGVSPPSNAPPEEIVRSYLAASTGVVPGPISSATWTDQPLDQPPEPEVEGTPIEGGDGEAGYVPEEGAPQGETEGDGSPPEIQVEGGEGE